MKRVKTLILVFIITILIACSGSVDGKDKKEPADTKVSKGKIGAALKLPDFSLLDLNGREYRLSENVGMRPVLLTFWTTNCPYCIKEIPRLNRIYTDKQEQLDILSINIMQPPQMVKGFIRAKGIKYPVLFDQKGEAAFSYKVRGVPTYVVVDLEGGMRYYGNSLDEAMKKIEGMAS